MRTLLTTLNAKYIHSNLAVRLLYGLNKNHQGLEWKEFTIKEDRDEIASYCINFNVIAFSCYIWNITQTLDLCRKIKALNPQTNILLGGPEVSYDYNDVIAKPEVDFIIVGEGETPFTEFLNTYPNIENVPGLVWKNNLQVNVNPTPPLFDLKKYEAFMPYEFDNAPELYNKVLYLETSRGCPYKCEFCLASLDNKVRYLPIETIKSTLLYLMKNGRVIKFLDRTFNIKRDFTLDIFQFILENHQPQNVFQFEITADILHPDIIKFIHEKVPKGLFRFEIGIQTVNQQANLAVSRKQNFEKTKRIIQELDYKVEMHLDLIVGLPLDYWTDIKHSFEEVFKLFAPEMQLGFLKFLKGTTMRDKEIHGYVYDPEPPYQLIESKYLSKNELHEITQLEHALEIYWNNKRACNTLRYVTNRYGSFDFLLGLGKHFGTQKPYHNYSLTDVFDILDSFVQKNYSNDKVLKELIALDYYFHFKVKPPIRYLEEVSKGEKNSFVLKHQLNHHKFRFALLPISFDYITFIQTNEIVLLASMAVIQYDGIQKAQPVLLQKPILESLITNK